MRLYVFLCNLYGHCLNLSGFTCIYYKSFGQPVSRVLYLTIIYLDVLSTVRSSDLPLGRQRAAAFYALSWSCSGWGLHGMHVTIPPGELLPHHFNLTTALPVSAVCFCCTFPIVTYARRYLASLPCGARTFLIHPEGARNCLDYPKRRIVYYKIDPPARLL